MPLGFVMFSVAGALMLVVVVFICPLLARVATRRLERMNARQGIRLLSRLSGQYS